MRPEVLDYELLVKAKQVIQKEKNWVQGSYQAGNAYCAVGALLVATGITSKDDIFETPTYKLLQQVIPKKFKKGMEDDGVSVEDFNDDDCTTHNMVMHLFSRAIAKAKALATAAFGK